MDRSWLIKFVILLILDLAAANDLTCPPPASFAPCTCRDGGERDGTTWVDCSNKNLGDARIRDILNVFLSSRVSPLGTLYLNNNSLTQVPEQIKLFPQLKKIWLDHNRIRMISSGAFDFIARLDKLSLYNNPVVSIEHGAFKGKYGRDSFIFLNNLNLTRFEAGVFKPVLSKMTSAYSGHIHIAGNPIDCSNDPCHLAWLIRDSRHFLKNVRFGMCTNSTYFEDLEPNGFSRCPTSQQEKASLIMAPFVCPKSDDNYPNPQNCTSYYMCMEEKPYFIECPTDKITGIQMVFNKNSKKCDQPANVPSCTRPFVCPSYEGTYANPDSCFSYYMCTYSKPYLINCPNEASVFNRNTGKCDLPHNVPGCGRPYSCPLSDGNYANPASCSSYYQCFRSASLLIECPVMDRMTGQKMAFNRATGSCDHPTNVPGCGTPYILLPSPAPTLKPPPLATTPTPANNRAPRAPMFCPFENGNFANPDSCFSYFQCIKGTSSLVECPIIDLFTGVKMAFNPETGFCDNPMNVPSCSVDKPFVCPSVNGNYANPRNCSTFYLCIDGTASIYKCATEEESGQLLAYNPSTGRCDNPDNVVGCTLTESYVRGRNPNPRPPPLTFPTTTQFPSSRRSTTTTTTTTTRRPPNTIKTTIPTTISTFRPNKPSKPFSCSGLPDGNHANPASCSSFYMCSNGIPHLTNCPGGNIAYNPTLGICDWAYNVPGCNNNNS